MNQKLSHGDGQALYAIYGRHDRLQGSPRCLRFSCTCKLVYVPERVHLDPMREERSWFLREAKKANPISRASIESRQSNSLGTGRLREAGRRMAGGQTCVDSTPYHSGEEERPSEGKSTHHQHLPRSISSEMVCSVGASAARWRRPRSVQR